MAGIEYSEREPRDPYRIVDYQSGESTGDQIAVTENGIRWRIVGQLPEPRTGDVQGHIIGNRIRRVW